MRSLARSTLSRALSRLSSESGSRRPPLGAHHPRGVSTGTGNGSASQNLHGTSSRLSRVHNQLVSQMRATFRAMEMSPDLAQRGKSPLANAKVKVSQAVMEKTQKNAVKITVNKTNSNTKQELRALSQRLERMLRERPEANNPDSLEVPRLVDLNDFFMNFFLF